LTVCRGHIEDVYDLSWSPDGNNIISGSIDNSAIIWDVAKGKSAFSWLPFRLKLKKSI